MADKKPSKPKTATDQFKHVSTLIEGLKSDNVQQFAAVNRSLGGVEKRLENHHGRIKILEEEKLERRAAEKAIEKYKREHPDVAQREYTKDSDNTVAVNKELLKAIGYLVLAIAALAAAFTAVK